MKRSFRQYDANGFVSSEVTFVSRTIAGLGVPFGTRKIRGITLHKFAPVGKFEFDAAERAEKRSHRGPQRLPRRRWFGSETFT